MGLPWRNEGKKTLAEGLGIGGGEYKVWVVSSKQAVAAREAQKCCTSCCGQSCNHSTTCTELTRFIISNTVAAKETKPRRRKVRATATTGGGCLGGYYSIHKPREIKMREIRGN